MMLEGSGDREHWTMLVPDGTLFLLPDEQLHRDTLAFAAGPYRYFRITWDDTNSARVSMPTSAMARKVGTRVPACAANGRCGVRTTSERTGHQPLPLRLPAAGLPVVALDLGVGGGAIHRFASVAESRFDRDEAAPAPLGTTRLVRVTRDGTTADALRIKITPPSEAELQLTIVDNENPPLDLQRVSLVLAELPAIYFEAPAGAVRARYGSKTAARPSYDLEALRDTIDLSKATEATWGPPATLPEPAESSPAPAMPDAGAPLDVAGFKTMRAFELMSPGLSALPLDAHALAHSRGPASRFADVRVLDDANRQVPYLVERREEPISLDVPIAPAPPARAPALKERGGRRLSLYKVTLPYANMPPATLVVETSARVFERRVMVGVERERIDRVGIHISIRWPRKNGGTWMARCRPGRWRCGWREPPTPSSCWLSTKGTTPSCRSPRSACCCRPIDCGSIGPAEVRSVSPTTATISNRRATTWRSSRRRSWERWRPKSATLAGGERVDSAPPELGRTVSAIFWVAMTVAVLILLAIIAKLLRTRTAEP